jgi:hypothetical protein
MITWARWQAAGEAVTAAAMLEYEREQVRLGRRPTLPCDTEAKQSKMTMSGVAVMTALRMTGAATAEDLAIKLDMSIHKVANNLHALSLTGRIRKSSQTPRTLKKNKTWLYEVVR